MKKISIIPIIFMMIMMGTFIPAVKGDNVLVEKEVEITSDIRYEYDSKINVANSSSNNYSNYNMLWSSFKDRYDVKGVTACTPTPPSLVNLSNDMANKWVHMGVPVSFTHQQIMEGSSEHWWRSPIAPQEDNYDVRLRLYRVNSLGAVNMTSKDKTELDINEAVNPAMVYDSENITVDSDNYLAKEDSVKLPEEISNDTLEYNFTYIKSLAPIYASEDYYAVFSFKGSEEPFFYVSQDDVGFNKVHKTNMMINDDTYLLREDFNADFDTGVLFQSGMSDHVGGTSVASIYDNSTVSFPYIEFWRKMPNINSGEYLTFNLPFIYNQSSETTIDVNFRFYDSSGSLMGTAGLLNDTNDFWIGSLSYTQIDENISGSVGDIYEIQFSIDFFDDVNYEGLRMWLYDFNNNFTKSYRYSSMTLKGGPEPIQYGFQIWHSLQVTDGEWDIVRPEELTEFADMRNDRDEGINWRTTITIVEHGILMASGPVGVATSMYIMKNYGNTPPHEVMLEWAKEGTKAIMDFAGMVGDALFKFGQWLWDVIEIVVEAIQYYGTALINLLVVGLSLFAYIMMSVIAVKTSFGIIILVTKGTEAMLEYYANFMDKIVGVSEKAMSLMPVV